MNIQKKILLLITGLLIGFVIILQVYQNEWEQDGRSITDPTIAEGKRLSEQYCSQCHRYPAPDLLPWQTWRFETLSAMAPFLGVDDPSSSYEPGRNPFLPDDFYPSEPVISREDWQKIRDYYLSESSQEWEMPEKNPPIITDSLFFESHYSSVQSEHSPTITSVKFDPGNRLIYASDFNSKTFMVFNEDLDLVHTMGIESTIANIQILSETWRTEPGPRNLLLTFMGNLYPSDAPYGSVRTGWYNPENHLAGIDSVLVTDITRPVESKLADLDMDGNQDLLVNEFGHRIGSLFWMNNFKDGTQQQRNTLINTPGCIQSHVLNYNNDERPDIVSLCTQTAQTIYLFTNQKNGSFARSTLLEFEVTAGSSSFEIHDFNNDSHPDILFTSGDNADFSKVLKPYHGVYIYLNDGQDHFELEWFYHINGAYNAKARDFDGDDDLDIAVISFFADYENSPEEGFLFFENTGKFTFTPYHHPSATTGRWQTMDVTDWSGNGREDIVLANFSMGPTIVPDSIRNKWQGTPHILVLENRSKD